MVKRKGQDLEEPARGPGRAAPVLGRPSLHLPDVRGEPGGRAGGSGELQKLGIEISQATVSKYVMRPWKPPSQTWRTFLTNHVETRVCVDFFTVSTVTFKVLFVVVVLAHHRRRVVHFNVSDPPPPGGQASSLWRRSPGACAMMPGCVTAMRSTGWCSFAELRPWGSRTQDGASVALQHPYVHAPLASCAASALDHVVVVIDADFHRAAARVPRLLPRCPDPPLPRQGRPKPRPVERLDQGRIVETPMVGGLHHRYTRQAA